MTYRYLASPYTHTDKVVVQERFEETEQCLAWLLGMKVWAYSPIVHCHALATKRSLPTDYKFWLDYNHAMILGSNGILVLCMEGWRESKGVQEEIKFARSNHLFIRHISPVNGTFSFLEDFG
jgi:hypothetical protein